eukprot:gb/GEZN01002370.1/.p1 GENE.gb/GEZN01002370.1/~~gb/GEZN01002370.1/.p1  ORF type:complete len:736 (+),score=99.76 gb/GEZN01002370.1/:152-2359(+)
MWILESVNEKKGDRVLFGNEEVKVGRGSDSQFQIKGDLGVSRVHCVLKVSSPKDLSNPDDIGSVRLTGFGKSGTFLVDEKEEKHRISDKECKIIKQQIQRFNLGTSIKGHLRLRWQPFVCVLSRVDKKDQDELRAVAVQLGVHITNKWDDRCTHIFMSTLIVTEKSLLGIIRGLPIVTPAWLYECLKVLRKSPSDAQLPDIKSFVPPEDPPAQGQVDLTIDLQRRKNLFCDIDFFVFQPKQRDRLKRMIRGSGGNLLIIEEPKDSSFWESLTKFVVLNPFTETGIPLDNYQPDNSLITTANTNLAVLNDVYDNFRCASEDRMFQVILKCSLDSWEPYITRGQPQLSKDVSPQPPDSGNKIPKKNKKPSKAELHEDDQTADLSKLQKVTVSKQISASAQRRKRKRSAWIDDEEPEQQSKELERQGVSKHFGHKSDLPHALHSTDANKNESVRNGKTQRRNRGAWKEKDEEVNCSSKSGEGEMGERTVCSPVQQEKGKRRARAVWEEKENEFDVRESPIAQPSGSSRHHNAHNQSQRQVQRVSRGREESQSPDKWGKRRLATNVSEDIERPLDSSRLNTKLQASIVGGPKIVDVRSKVLLKDVPFRSAKVLQPVLRPEVGLDQEDSVAEPQCGSVVEEEEIVVAAPLNSPSLPRADSSALNFKSFNRKNENATAVRRQRMKNYVPFDQATESQIINRGWEEEHRREKERAKAEEDLFNSNQSYKKKKPVAKGRRAKG